MIKKILVPTDGSEHSQKAIEIACDLTSKYDADLHIIHVVENYEIPQGVKDYMKGEEIHEAPEYVYLKLVGDKIIEKAESEARQHGVENVKTAVLRGRVSARILEYANEVGADTIILGSRGAGGIEGAIMGSVSRKVCHLAECTCMTVK